MVNLREFNRMFGTDKVNTIKLADIGSYTLYQFYTREDETLFKGILYHPNVFKLVLAELTQMLPEGGYKAEWKFEEGEHTFRLLYTGYLAYRVRMLVNRDLFQAKFGP